MLNERNKNFIKEQALEASPYECCGLLVSNGKGGERVVRCRNTAENPKENFTICPEDYLKGSSEGEIVGTYHSHTNHLDVFSEFDKFNSESHKLKYILYCLKNDTFLEYDPDYEFNSYAGIEFKIGEADCYNLVKDFYNKELSIKLNDYFRDENWRDNLEELFDKNYTDEGFAKVEGEYKKYDCHLFKYKKNSPSQHIAVNLGDDLILHQPLNSLSRIERLTDRHKQYINYTIRHKDLL